MSRGLLLPPVPSSITPPINLLLLLFVANSALVPVADTVPPLIVPAARFHEPLLLSSSNVADVAVRGPVRLTVRALRLKVPSPAVVKVPPRLIVELALLSVLMVPRLLQEFAGEIVPPFFAWIALWLVQLTPVSVMVPE